MVLPDFKYFLKIVQYGSISKAAESLYISQPSLTKYLKNLEKELGILLFDRSQKPLTLTDAGKSFYEYVRHIDEENQNLIEQIDEIKSAGRATITLGMPLWRSSVILPEFLPLFFSRHPLVGIKLKEGSTTVLEDALMNNEIDFAIVNLPINYANVLIKPIAEEYIFMIGNRNNPIISKLLSEFPDEASPTIDIRDFRNCPFILTQSGQHITNYVNEMLSRYHIELPCVIKTSNVTTAVNMAASDMGFTFVPEIGVNSHYFPKNDIATFKVNDPPFQCTLAAVYKKSKRLSQAASIFIDEFQEFCNSQRKT